MGLVEQADAFATMAHAGQMRRDSGLEYITHPRNVAQNVRTYYGQYENLLKHDMETLEQVALLHDVVEDTHIRLPDIWDKFGGVVSTYVDELTTDDAQLDAVGASPTNNASQSKDKTQYLIRKMNAMSLDALFVKLCDRLDNVRDYLENGKDIERASKYAVSTLTILINVKATEQFGQICLEIAHTCNKIFLKRYNFKW